MAKTTNNRSLIPVEITYARSTEDQKILTVWVPVDTTVKTAILQSTILTHYPEIDLRHQTVGIFSRPVRLDQTVNAGDRIEIYRPLVIDPKTARSLRAVKKR
ncbi:MAG: hypothetical protein K0R12_1040 [Gammaproteobacteria bacterium]|jgi:putative ubiquitin-RnfH superfamily antitoxin RatB of RatAB toxin-antitoxin module|nr:hypothetical protein [Gammaproteobacteria bacterium]